MPARKKMVSRVIFALFVFALVMLPQRVAPQSQSAEEAVPAFHSAPPRGTLPDTLSPNLFGSAIVQNAYALAAKVKKILYQQPCYCHCDRSQGHGSLLDCFAGRHGSECSVCIREALYTFEQTQKGKTAAQIRKGIESSEWQQVDLSKYQTPVGAQ
jgi:Protein of unknown function with PCYCGC motif